MTNRAPSLQPGGWIWFHLFMIQFRPIDNYWMAIKNTLSVSIQLLTELWNTHKTTTNGHCALLRAAEAQRGKCFPPPCIPPPSYNTGTKLEPHQEVVVWEVCITLTVTIPLSLALGREKENKDDEVKGALGKLRHELQCHSWMTIPTNTFSNGFDLTHSWEDGFSWVLFSGTHSSPKTKIQSHKAQIQTS